MNRIKIMKIKIKNFRGYLDEKIFSFDPEKKLIIISGINGLGKTSLLEAIEWAFTGSIKRLKIDLISRKEFPKTSSEGFIKHINSINMQGENKKSYVKLELLINQQCVVLERILENEDFDYIKKNKELPSGDITIQFMNQINQDQRNEIENILKSIGNNDSFNKNICSYDKNIQLYSQDRKEWAEFIYNYLYDKNLAENYTNNANDLIKKIENKENELKIHKNQLIERKEKLEEMIKMINNFFSVQQIYPEKIYKGEKNIDDFSKILSDKTINEQLQIQLVNLGKIKEFLEKAQYYSKAKEYLKLLRIKIDYAQFKKIKQIYTETLKPYFFNLNIQLSDDINQITENVEKLGKTLENLKRYKQMNYQESVKTIFNKDFITKTRIVQL